jgi:hypothetical protein
MNDPEPSPPVDIGSHQAEYNGRKFFGEKASDRAELTYLRDWKAWVERHPLYSTLKWTGKT